MIVEKIQELMDVLQAQTGRKPGIGIVTIQLDQPCFFAIANEIQAYDHIGHGDSPHEIAMALDLGKLQVVILKTNLGQTDMMDSYGCKKRDYPSDGLKGPSTWTKPKA